MHRLRTASLIFAQALVMVVAACASPALADTFPPEIGLVSPGAFQVNHSTLIRASVTSKTGLSACNLFVNGLRTASMSVLDNHVSATEVFSTPETRDVQIRCQDAQGNIGYSPVTRMFAEKSETSRPGVLPAGFTPEMLIQLSCLPDERDGEHCHSIYYVGRDAKRHAFQSVGAFLSWYPAETPTMPVSLAMLASLPLGAPISAKPGHAAVRFLSQPMVYAVSGPLQLRKFLDEVVTQSALGVNWKSHLDVLTDAFYGNFVFGATISNPNELHVLATTPDDVITR